MRKKRYLCTVVLHYNTNYPLSTCIYKPTYDFMKRIATLCLIAAIFTLSANAQLLWKIEGNNAKAPSYVFGTHHVAPADMATRVNGLTDALEAVDAVYGEINMVDINPMEMQQMVLAHSMAPADSTLSKIFTPAQLDSIQTLMQAYAGPMVNLTQLDMLKPVLLSTQLAVMQAAKAIPDFDPQAQLDATLQTMAQSSGKEVGGLETMEYQLGILYDSPISEQAKDLMDAVRNDAEAQTKAKSLADAYLNADLDAISAALYDDPDMTPEKLEKLLLTRNRNWAAALPAIISEKPVLIVVGSGHLPGDEGLLQLLRKQGYTVTPVDKK